MQENKSGCFFLNTVYYSSSTLIHIHVVKCSNERGQTQSLLLLYVDIDHMHRTVKTSVNEASMQCNDYKKKKLPYFIFYIRSSHDLLHM